MVFLLLERNVNKHYWQITDLKTDKIVKLTNTYKDALRYIKEAQVMESDRKILV